MRKIEYKILTDDIFVGEKGKYYYFSKTTGKMQKSKWIGKYYVNSKGVRTKKK